MNSVRPQKCWISWNSTVDFPFAPASAPATRVFPQIRPKNFGRWKNTWGFLLYVDVRHIMCSIPSVWRILLKQSGTLKYTLLNIHTQTHTHTHASSFTSSVHYYYGFIMLAHHEFGVPCYHNKTTRDILSWFFLCSFRLRFFAQHSAVPNVCWNILTLNAVKFFSCKSFHSIQCVFSALPPISFARTHVSTH